MQLEYILTFFLLNKMPPLTLERVEMYDHDLHGRRRPNIKAEYKIIASITSTRQILYQTFKYYDYGFRLCISSIYHVPVLLALYATILILSL
jgi:hypothetical protein